MSEKEELKKLVLDFFQGDELKTRKWFTSENPSLGNISPNALLEMGKGKNLLSWAKHQLGELDRMVMVKS